MAGRYLLCVCCLALIIRSVVDATGGTGTRSRHDNSTVALHTSSYVAAGSWVQEKPKRIFSRTRYLPPVRSHVHRPVPDPPGEAHSPIRRCARRNESCSVNTPCCESCASCHCRLFNTICHCWRLGACHRRT